MFGFILGAAAGAAGYWAYQRYVVGTDDDAFADFETSSLERPSPSEIHGRPSDPMPGSCSSSTTSSGPSSTLPGSTS
jgi:hypothetical protein